MAALRHFWSIRAWAVPVLGLLGLGAFLWSGLADAQVPWSTRALNSLAADGDTVAASNYYTLIAVIDAAGAADRMSGGYVLGASIPGTPTILSVDGSSSCASAAAVGYYEFQVRARGQSDIACCVAGASCTAATTDAFYTAGVIYRRAVTDAAANDVYCCISYSAGTDVADVVLTPITH